MDMISKLNSLLNWFDNKNNAIVALSGGVDSALVAYAAFQKLKRYAIAVTADYKTLSHEELESAKHVASEIGITHILLNYNELENTKFTSNNSNRCFYCRMELGTHLRNLAYKYNISTIVDGTNVDDLGDYRPGINALRKNEIQSPLVETGFTKNEIRITAKSIGLSVYDRPSNSCLASRIPWGQQITAEKLTRIEYGEMLVKQITGIKQVRVRDLKGSAKIEVEKINLGIFDKDILNEISDKLLLIGFNSVEIDKDGYSPGKINVITD